MAVNQARERAQDDALFMKATAERLLFAAVATAIVAAGAALVRKRRAGALAPGERLAVAVGAIGPVGLLLYLVAIG